MSALRECYQPNCFGWMMCENITVFPCEGLNDNGDVVCGEPFDLQVYSEGRLQASVDGTVSNNTFFVSFTEIRHDDQLAFDGCGDCLVCPSSIREFCNPCTGEKHWEVTT